MIFFDYIFYRVYKIYIDSKDKAAFITSVIVLSIPQSLNLLTLIAISSKNFGLKLNPSNTIFIVVLETIIMILNYIRYSCSGKFRLDAIKKKWTNISGLRPLLFDCLIITYFIISAVLFYYNI
jgi:hypothetical protein